MDNKKHVIHIPLCMSSPLYRWIQILFFKNNNPAQINIFKNRYKMLKINQYDPYFHLMDTKLDTKLVNLTMVLMDTKLDTNLVK